MSGTFPPLFLRGGEGAACDIGKSGRELQAVTIYSEHIAPSKILSVELPRRQMWQRHGAPGKAFICQGASLFVEVGLIAETYDTDDSC